MIALPAGEAQVWAVDLGSLPGDLGPLEASLSGAERDRASRFVFPDDRRRFIAAHAALREVLAAYLGRSPRDLAFATGPRGKLRLADAAEAWLQFNLSHSHEAALIVCARERAVGADIEWMRADVDCAEIVERFFSAEERREWAGLPPAEQREAFFRGWTCKEAYVKALGEGLSHPPEAYTVRLGPAHAAALLADTRRPGTASAWSLHTVPAPAGYSAAVAVEGAEARMVLDRWKGPRPDFVSKNGRIR